ASERGRADQLWEAGPRPLRRVGAPDDGPRAGDGLLPALPRAPGDRTGLRIDVRDHRGADPGVAAGRVEARQDPPGLQRVRELARLAAEVRVRSGTRGLGSRSVNRSAVRDVSDGILYWPLNDSGAPPSRHIGRN